VPARLEARRRVSATPRPAALLHRFFILAGILLVAMNLRSPIVAVAPVLDRIVTDIGLTAVTAGLLTSLPVLAFALTTPVAAALLGRIGPDFAVATALVGVIVGVAIRSTGTEALLFTGTIVMGFAITLGNVMVPVLIRRNYPPAGRAGVTGLYTAALNVGSMLTLVATVPIADALGWRLGLNVWSGLAVIALVTWLAAVGWRRFALPSRMDSEAEPTAEPTAGQHARDTELRAEIPAEASTGQIPTGANLAQRPRLSARARTARLVLLALGFGGQAFSYYGLTAWLPQILAALSDIPTAVSSAGSSLFQVFAIVGALGVPVLTRRAPYWAIVAMVGALWLMVPLGLLLSPELWVLWLSLGGIAQGGTFTLVFIVVVELATTDSEAGRGSALVQGIGYAIGATGPSVFGALHDLTGGWTVPLLAIVVAVALLATGASLASRGMGAGRAVAARPSR
jgi:CP family cyanate transporter-like MFS transporter